ncbi:hypothetical protein PENSUB_7402 [Penicillium subrubescens]|uniref:NAD dependent epimerase/dehydratase n=1 Tax=Penicillium subrubescens TaxID=1316194 RepID=A0A1Q5TMH1_9EURO|nr:hypothetical protein PENSUB_7402 [Penicillium subrubescens]
MEFYEKAAPVIPRPKPMKVLVLSLPRTGTTSNTKKALSDDPCCLFVEELLSAYPNAKIILTTRDRAAWLRSMQRFILEILSWRSMRLLSYLDPEFTGPYQALLNRTTTVLSGGQPPCAPSSVPALLASFDSHYERVRAAVPPDQLLEFHPGMGWDPLCGFLGVEVPEVAFPHLNSGSEAMELEVELYWDRWAVVGRRFVRRAVFLLAFCGLLVLARR